MDWVILIIGFSLVFVGAAFFGFPVGYVYSRSRVWKEIERDHSIDDTDVIDFFALSENRKRRRDVLSAEIIEEVR